MVVANIEEARISRLEGANEQVDRRHDDMNTRLDATNQSIEGVRAEMNSRFEEMNSRFGEMNNRYNTLIMLMIVSWVTIFAALIAYSSSDRLLPTPGLAADAAMTADGYSPM